MFDRIYIKKYFYDWSILDYAWVEIPRTYLKYIKVLDCYMENDDLFINNFEMRVVI